MSNLIFKKCSPAWFVFVCVYSALYLYFLFLAWTFSASRCVFICIYVLFHFLVFSRNNIRESGKRIFYFLCHCDVDNLVLPSTLVVVFCEDFFILSLSEHRRPSLTVTLLQLLRALSVYCSVGFQCFIPWRNVSLNKCYNWPNSVGFRILLRVRIYSCLRIR